MYVVDVVLNMNTTVATSASVTDARDPDDRRDWFDIVLPALGVGFVFLVCLVSLNYLLKFLKNFKSCCNCCSSNSLEDQERPPVAGHENPGNINDDLPPSYSVAGLGRSSVEIFRVVADDVSDVTNWHAESEFSDKLPTYLEIMEEKQLKAENTRANSPERSATLNQEAEVEFNINLEDAEVSDSDSVRLPHATIETNNQADHSESETEPPPYETVPL